MSNQSVELVTEGPIPILTLAQIMGLDFELPSRSSLGEDAYQSLIASHITDLWEQIYHRLVSRIVKTNSDSESPGSDSANENDLLLPRSCISSKGSSPLDELESENNTQGYNLGHTHYTPLPPYPLDLRQKLAWEGQSTNIESEASHYSQSNSRSYQWNHDIDLTPITRKQASSIVSDLKIAEPSWRAPNIHVPPKYQDVPVPPSLEVKPRVPPGFAPYTKGNACIDLVRNPCGYNPNTQAVYVGSHSNITNPNTNTELSSGIMPSDNPGVVTNLQTYSNTTNSVTTTGFKQTVSCDAKRVPQNSPTYVINTNRSTIRPSQIVSTIPENKSGFAPRIPKNNLDRDPPQKISRTQNPNPWVDNDTKLESTDTHFEVSLGTDNSDIEAKDLIYRHPLSRQRDKSPLTLTKAALIKKKSMENKRLVLEALSEIKATLSGRKITVVAKQINNSYSPLAQYKSVHSIKDIENIIQNLADEGHVSLNLSKERFAIEIPANMIPPGPKFTKDNLKSIITEMSHQLSNVVCFDGAVKVLVNSYSKWASFDKQTKEEYATAAVYLLLKNKMLS
jgi:hypothetical protein